MTVAQTAVNSRTYLWMVFLFFFAFGIRLFWIEHMNYFDPKGIEDGITKGDCYHCIAKRIIEKGLGKGFGPPTKPLGYPMFLAAMYKLVGDRVLLVRYTQAAIDSFSCLLIARLGLLLFGGGVGILSGILAAFYPFFMRDAARISSETLFMLLFVASILFVFKASKTLHPRDILLSGLFLGLSSFVKPAPIVLVPVILIYLGYVLWPRRRQIVVVLLSFCILPPLISIPWGIRNYLLGYGFATTETRGGLTFYLGNSELTVIRFTKQTAPEDWNRDLENYPSSYFYAKAFRFIREHPGTYVKLLGYKAAEFWRIFPLENWTLPAIAAHMVIPPLGMLGVLLSLKRRQKEAFFSILLMTTFTVFFTIYNTELRYRLPIIDPLLIVYAAYLLCSLLQTAHVKNAKVAFSLLMATPIFLSLSIGRGEAILFL